MPRRCRHDHGHRQRDRVHVRRRVGVRRVLASRRSPIAKGPREGERVAIRVARRAAGEQHDLGGGCRVGRRDDRRGHAVGHDEGVDPDRVRGRGRSPLPSLTAERVTVNVPGVGQVLATDAPVPLVPSPKTHTCESVSPSGSVDARPLSATTASSSAVAGAVMRAVDPGSTAQNVRSSPRAWRCWCRRGRRSRSA